MKTLMLTPKGYYFKGAKPCEHENIRLAVFLNERYVYYICDDCGMKFDNNGYQITSERI